MHRPFTSMHTLIYKIHARRASNTRAQSTTSLSSTHATKSTGALSVLQGTTETKLNGVLKRIDTLIGGYTKGASTHSSFLRHFDQDSVVLGGTTLKSVGRGVGSHDGDVLFMPAQSAPKGQKLAPKSAAPKVVGPKGVAK